MSFLFDKMKEEWVILNKNVVEGALGVIPTWTEGASINISVEYLSSTEARVAEISQKLSNWKITVSPEVSLEKNDVIRRKSDGLTLKIDVSDNVIKTPEVATFQFKEAFAYEFSTSSETRV